MKSAPHKNKHIIAIIIAAVVIVIGIITTVAILLANNTHETKSATARSLDQAKHDLQSVEDEILAYVPASVITETYPKNQTSRALVECGDRDTYSWPGSAEVRVTSSTDSRSILEAIYGAWKDKSGWTVKWARDDGLDISRNDGLRVNIASLENNTTITLQGFTACFVLHDRDPNKEY